MKKQEKKERQQSEPQEVNGFQGYYSFLNNDFPAWVSFDGNLYPSVNTAYQAARTNDPVLRKKISAIENVEEFKEIVMSIKNPPNWNEKRYEVMLHLIRDKFKRNKDLIEKLMGTKDKKLMNTLKHNGPNELYWGLAEGNGRNILGKIIMHIRDEFLKGDDTKHWIETLKLEKDPKMHPTVHLLVEKAGKKIDKLFLQNKSYYLFGKAKTCEFILENPTISRYHSCVYFSHEMEVVLIDLNSTHGTLLNKEKLEPLIEYKLQKQDKIQFGTSERIYTIEIDWSEMEKNLKETEKELKVELERSTVKNENLEELKNLSREEMRRALGIEEKCIVVENSLIHQKEVQELVEKIVRVKKARKIVDRMSGKTEKTILYFHSSKEVSEVVKGLSGWKDKFKLRAISEEEAENLLTKNVDKKPQGRERSREHNKNQN